MTYHRPTTTLLLLQWVAFRCISIEAFFTSPRIVIDARSSGTSKSETAKRNKGGTSIPPTTPSTELLLHLQHHVVPKQREVDLCIIGGGVSGLAAAISAAQTVLPSSFSKHDDITISPPPSILLLESTSTLGGRVQSDITSDGYILDKGFAVFVEEYPVSKKLLEYDALGLQPFLPGARVKLKCASGEDADASSSLLACVSDPIRRPKDILKIITSPVGSALDKLRLVPLFFILFTKSIEELFEMEESDTLSCLQSTYHFSEEFISTFFAPFLEGVYLVPLQEQSSRMFHFVMKMFTIGSVSLPKGGMQAVTNQLDEKARELGVDIRLESRVVSIAECVATQGRSAASGDPTRFVVEVDSTEGGKDLVKARCVIIATDVGAARQLIPNSIASPPKQRSVGCIYYGFRSPAPLTDPILILNGEGSAENGSRRNTKGYPINNVCFPSVVQRGYAPVGYDLCSVSILEEALAEYEKDDEHASLDGDVRKQLATWFPNYANDILDEKKWVRKGVYVIPNAQPAHYHGGGSSNRNGNCCANVHGGRDCSTFQGMKLPHGMLVCGDHMATSSLNGALESGVNAGDSAAHSFG
jgi:phytoene dehydrogenase-like protein